MSDWRTPSVVRIWARDKSQPVGMGFVIDGRHIMTCAHIVGAALGDTSTSPAIARAMLPPEDPVPIDFLVLNEREPEPRWFSARAIKDGWRPVDGANSPGDVAVLELVEAEKPIGANPVRVSLMLKPNDELSACVAKRGQPRETWVKAQMTGEMIQDCIEVFAEHDDPAIRQGCLGGAAFLTAGNGIAGMLASMPTSTKKGLIIPVEQLQKVWPIGGAAQPQSTTDTLPREPYRVEGRPARFFISYRRRAADDARLAQLLREELERAGQEVFIDVSMPAGIDWVAEIEKRIKWCDFLVVLLSEQSIHSEMVQAEVRFAHHDRSENGRPGIVPVRVNFEGRLDYELSSYIGRLQYVSWKSADDDRRVIDAIVQAAGFGVRKVSDLVQRDGQVLPADNRRPTPSVDRGTLIDPTGTMAPNDPFYLRRPADDTVDRLIARPGRTLVIKGPRQMGKSSLLVRYLDGCLKHGKKRAFLDFQAVSNQQLADYPRFLAGVVKTLFRRLGLQEEPIPQMESAFDVTDFIESRILARVDEPIALACDETDRLLGQPWQNEFFGMLRIWHNNRWKPEWGKVDLALVISTEPYMLISSGDQSPFNVGEIVKLGAFAVADVEELGQRYGAQISAAQVRELFELLGGHPYLTRLALYRLATDSDQTFRKLVDTAANDNGPFIEHLKALLLLVQRAQLAEPLREVIRTGRLPGDNQEAYHRLRGAGLIVGESNTPAPASLLYAQFFKRTLR